MKKNLYLIASLLSIIFLLNSCASSQVYQSQRKADVENAKVTTTGCFVEFNDGSLKNYSTLVLVKGVLKTPHLLADGKTRIDAKDIKAYQNKEHYAISQTVFNPKRRSLVAVESLPGFAVRIAKGDLNVYVRKTYNTQKAVDEFFLQAGTDGEIVEYSYTLMNDFIKNSPEAKEFFNNKKYKAPKPRKLKVTAEIYNNSQSITKTK